ncbi:hypothetical protein ED208_13010 [Stagnimonas aquatica]|uniref:Uncharacterized protein n=1 Tax=Stagnimonas aquatica TaxID=2689987 RepID=A0A3N0V7G1_9GAMM|nr:hypothetical protein [Stagnimonas aquatica]ROH88730.1 hypothetical protein ED208_13010 [Stagnimonas aquatica]
MSASGGDPVHQSFLAHAQFRWAKLALALCLLSLVAYLWHQPVDGANGGTWLGYTLGGIGAALILCLLWLGVRKRQYRSRLGTVKGWTSAHVYLGLSLLLIVSLHCGFQFGLNIHTLAYVLMVLVIGSGLWGLIAYDRLPGRITRLHGGGNREAWIEEVLDLNEQAIGLANALSPEVHSRIVASADKLQLGGGLRAQLFGPRRKQGGDGLRESLEKRIAQLRSGPSRGAATAPGEQNTVMFMAGQLRQTAGGEQEAAGIQKLLDLLAHRNELVARINQDVALHARLQLWLLLHVPLSLALLAALVAHVFSVFFYW